MKRYAYKVSRAGKKPAYYETKEEATFALFTSGCGGTLWVARTGAKAGGWKRQFVCL